MLSCSGSTVIPSRTSSSPPRLVAAPTRRRSLSPLRARTSAIFLMSTFGMRSAGTNSARPIVLRWSGRWWTPYRTSSTTGACSTAPSACPSASVRARGDRGAWITASAASTSTSLRPFTSTRARYLPSADRGEVAHEVEYALYLDVDTIVAKDASFLIDELRKQKDKT